MEKRGTACPGDHLPLASCQVAHNRGGTPEVSVESRVVAFCTGFEFPDDLQDLSSPGENRPIRPLARALLAIISLEYFSFFLISQQSAGLTTLVLPLAVAP